MHSESDDKYFSTVNLSTQLLISLCKTERACRLNTRPSMLFPSLHNFRASSKNFACRYAARYKNPFQLRMKSILEVFRHGTSRDLIPLGRSVEVNLDRLFRAGNVVPPPEGFPSFRHNLYQHSPKRRIR